MWRSECEPFRDFPAIEFERLLRAVAATGADPAVIRRALGLPPDDLPPRVPVSLFTAALLAAERLTGNLQIGIHAAGHSEINHLTRALCAAQPTFGECIRRFLEFQTLLFGTNGMNALHESSGVRLVFCRGIDTCALRHVVEFYVRGLCREAIELAGPSAQPLEIRFAHAPSADDGVYRAVFGCRVQFHAADSGMLFSRELLEAPIATANAAIASQLQRLAQAQLGRLPISQLSGRVASALEAAILSRQSVQCSSIARHLGMSTRTLQRRLGSEDLTFRLLLDRVRQHLITRVMEPDLEHPATVGELADLVGFEEPASICRAFKRWMGEPLSSWSTDRQKRQESGVAPASV